MKIFQKWFFVKKYNPFGGHIVSITEQEKPMAASRSLHTWSLPNLLTYGRVLAVPALVGFFFLPEPFNHYVCFAVFVTASVTDLFDGHLARVWQQESAIGKMLDPIADKVLVGVALLMLAWARMISDWHVIAGAIILFREFLVPGLREFLAQRRVSVPVTFIAKGKVHLQAWAIAVLLISPVVDEWLVLSIIHNVGIGILWVAAAVTAFTGYTYFRVALQHLKDEEEH